MLLFAFPHFLFQQGIFHYCSGVSGESEIRHVCLVYYLCPGLPIYSSNQLHLSFCSFYFLEAAIVVNNDPCVPNPMVTFVEIILFALSAAMGSYIFFLDFMTPHYFYLAACFNLPLPPAPMHPNLSIFRSCHVYPPTC